MISAAPAPLTDRAGKRPPKRLGELVPLPRFFALFCLLAGMATARPQVMDPDFWWHLRNGSTMLRTGHLIHINPYAFMAAGHHWVLQEWLSEVWMAAATAAAGRLGVVLGYWLITLAMYVTIWLRAATIGRPNGVTIGVGLVLAAITAYPILGPRSQMETYLLIGVTLLVVERQLRHGGRIAWVLPPIFLIWNNLHAGFIMGLILLVAVLASEWLLVGLGMRDSGARRNLIQLSWATLCGAAASLVNPNGPVILVYPFQTQFSNAQQSLIQEWHSPDFHMVVLLPLLFFVVTSAWLVVKARRVPLRDVVVLGLALLVTMQSVRNLVILVVVATPVWITLADSLRARWANGMALKSRARQPLSMLAAEFLLLVTLLGTLGTQIATEATPTLSSTTYVDAFPVCAARWLDLAPTGLRVFNQYGDGGFLAYTVPQDKVFVFGDAALMGPRVLRDYAAIIDLAPTWLRRLNSSGAQVVVFERGNAFVDALQQEPSWHLVYRDKRVEGFERTSLLSRLRLPPNPSPSSARTNAGAACASQAEPLPA
ncbi:MAG: hypothetical protein M0027_01870 [Candidatus Dormibacteraeota bacterium]|nr:hypothetical protein [Candidatus Dormibacteraeota bacterium]